jgi:hypothetical protein
LRSYGFLKKKYGYAIALAREFVPALRLKLKMIQMLILIALTFTLSYILIVVLETSLVQQHAVNLSLVINYHIELFILGILLFVFRSRVFPANFNVSLEEFHMDTTKMGDVYNCKIPTLKKLANSGSELMEYGFLDKLFKNDIKYLKKEAGLPLLVINPVFDEENEHQNSLGSLNTSVSNSTNQSHESVTTRITVAYMSKF